MNVKINNEINYLAWKFSYSISEGYNCYYKYDDTFKQYIHRGEGIINFSYEIVNSIIKI